MAQHLGTGRHKTTAWCRALAIPQSRALAIPQSRALHRAVGARATGPGVAWSSGGQPAARGGVQLYPDKCFEIFRGFGCFEPYSDLGSIIGMFKAIFGSLRVICGILVCAGF